MTDPTARAAAGSAPAPARPPGVEDGGGPEGERRAEHAVRDWTFRDAGPHALPLPIRLLNSAGRLFSASRLPRLDPERLIEAACERTGLDDFGDGAFREGLDALAASLDREAQLHSFARVAQRSLLTGCLERRLRLIDWAKRHPELRKERIAAPLVVLGMPRTGTTLLSHLLDLDPRTRSLRAWESTALTPPPQLATRAEDPRLAQSARQEARMGRWIPPLAAMHPLGASLPTECVPLHMLDFRSLGFETQALLPSYGRWLEQCDMRSAYAIHELALQTLQSAIPTDRWALKTPNHLWALDALLERYPDARLVWTHRDPAQVLPSVASLNTAFHRTWTSQVDPASVGAAWLHKLHLAVSRGIEFDERAAGRAWCHHLLYEDLMDDPIEAVRGIYASFGEELSPLHEASMRAWMRNRPQSRFGRHRYDLRDFGFTRDAIDERFADYCKRFGVPREARG